MRHMQHDWKPNINFITKMTTIEFKAGITLLYHVTLHNQMKNYQKPCRIHTNQPDKTEKKRNISLIKILKHTEKKRISF